MTESPQKADPDQLPEVRPISRKSSAVLSNSEVPNPTKRQSSSVGSRRSLPSIKASEEITDLDAFLKKRKNNYIERKQTLKVFLRSLDIEIFDDFMRREHERNIMDTRTTLDQAKKSLKDSENFMLQKKKSHPMYVNEFC